MRDFNFFSPYLQEKKNRHQKRMFIVSASLLLVLTLGAFTYLNLLQIRSYREEIAKVQAYLNAPKTIEMIQRYEAVSSRMVLTEEYYEKVKEADDAIGAFPVMNTTLLDQLASAMPADTRIQSLNGTGHQLVIRYTTGGMVSAAELQHNLNQLELFQKVHVNLIQKEETYSIELVCQLKDVNAYEAKADK